MEIIEVIVFCLSSFSNIALLHKKKYIWIEIFKNWFVVIIAQFYKFTKTIVIFLIMGDF